MIRVILVDDERPALEELEYWLAKYPDIQIVSMFQDAYEAFEQVLILKPDVVFLDIEMMGMNGIEMALKIRDLDSRIIIIFVTAYSQYALDAFQSYPLDYILKPVNEKNLTKTINQLRYRLQFQEKMEGMEEKKTVVCCFKDYDVFVERDEKLHLKFATRQTREMLAYLICNYERRVTRQELIDRIFGGIEDKKTINLLHVTAYNLRRALEELGIGRSSIAISGNYIIEIAEGICDYIDFSKFIHKHQYIDRENIGQAEKIAALYCGTYLENEDYEWADEMRTELEQQYEGLIVQMAKYYKENGELEKSEKKLRELLQYDPLHENGYEILLEYYMEQGKINDFREYYQMYGKILREEFRSRPVPEFARYYNKYCKRQ